MDQLDLERAIEQVEARTHGLSNLMRTRTLDKLYTQEGLYKAFADEMGGRESVKNSFQCNECFKVSGWASSGDQTGFYTGNEIKDV